MRSITARTTARIAARFALALLLSGGISVAWSAPAAKAVPATSAIKPESITIAVGSITYATRAGDTLSSIAEQLTNKAANWVAIGQANHISADTNIPIGTAIIIPANLLPDEPSEAKVVALSGTITAKTAQGAAETLALGAKVVEGMQIDTGNNGFMTLSLPDDSRISLPSNSRIQISKLRMARYTKSPRTEITLLRGRVESRISPIEKNKGRFEVLTPLGVAGVRGTHFRVSMDDKATTNEVLSGNVAVGQPGKASALTLTGGQGNVITAKSVGKAQPLLPAPQFSEAPVLQGAASAQFSVQPVAGAQGYHLQLASDKDGQNVFSETRSDKTKFELGGVREGSYFARISAIDPSGIEGTTRTQAVNLYAGTNAVHATSAGTPKKNAQGSPFVESSDKKQVLLRWAATPGQKFNIQIARDAAFSWLLFTVNTSESQVHVPRPEFGTYYARVQTINADGSANPFSNIQPFIVTDQWVINDGKPIAAKPGSPNAAR